jgi:hypothetical protein
MDKILLCNSIFTCELNVARNSNIILGTFKTYQFQWEAITRSVTYESYIDHLRENPADRDLPILYSTYCDHLSDYIEEQTGFSINLFEENFTDSNVNSERVLFSFLSTLGLLERIKVIEEKFGYYQCKESSYELDDGEEWDNTLVGFAIEDAEEVYENSHADKKALLKGSYLTERIFDLLPQ